MDIALEEGKRYRMRNGYLTGPLKRRTNNGLLFGDTYENSSDTTLITHYRSWGRFGNWGVATITYPEDIVEEYIEESVNTFATQQEIWAYLSTGGFVKNVKEDTIILGFDENGTLLNYGYHINCPSDWVKTDKPANWYDNIPEQGILCWVNYHTDREDITNIRIITDYDSELDRPFIQTSRRFTWKYARPVTLDEIKPYLLEEQK